MNKIRDAFSQIQAESELVHKTMQAVTEKAARKKPRSLARRMSLVAGAACLFMLLLAGGVLYTSQTALISIDVNPSIELSLNRFDQVVKATAKNEDGNRVLSEIELQNLKYQDALERIIAAEQALGYLQDGADMVFAVQSENGAQRESLLTQSERYAIGIVGEQHTTCYAVNGDEWEKAHEQGITPGKYKVIQELQEYDPTVTMDEYAHHSMREIRQEIRHHQEGGDLSKESGAEQETGNGSGRGNSSHGDGNGNNGNHGNNGYGGNGHGFGGNGANHE